MKDYYKILDIDPGSTPETIKVAYRVQAKKYHPDLNQSSEAATKFKEVSEAYQVLSNPFKKREYDTSVHVNPGSQRYQSWGKVDPFPDDFFDSMFGANSVPDDFVEKFMNLKYRARAEKEAQPFYVSVTCNKCGAHLMVKVRKPK